MDESGGGVNEMDHPCAKEVLRNGTTAHHIRSPGQGADTILICTHFGFRIDRTVLCGICPCSHVFPPTAVIQDVARWLHNHWRYLAYGRTNTLLPVHDKGKLPPVIQISKLLARSLDVAHENVPLSTFNVYHRSTGLLLLEETWLVTRYVDLGGFAQVAGDEVSVCRKCLSIVRKNLICCTSSQVIKIKCLHPGPRIRKILCTSNGTLLDDQKLLLPPPAQHVAQPITLQALPLPLLPAVQSTTELPRTTLLHAPLNLPAVATLGTSLAPTATPYISRASLGGGAIPVSLPRTNISASTASSVSSTPLGSPITQLNFDLPELNTQTPPPAKT